jgi:SAM-dependent methyltransferase
VAEFDEEYAKIYDEIYASKDYQAECAFVRALHRRLTGQSRPRAVLDLGCGTGRHLSHFPSDAVRIGVDQSLSMVTGARRRGLPSIEFIHSKIGEFRNSREFDLVYSLFHVVNYHVSDSDLRAFFLTVRSTLSPDGIAVIDSWNRAAWTSDPPGDRVRFLRDDRSLIRATQADVDYSRDRVLLKILTFLRAPTGTFELLPVEEHEMRAFAPQSIAEMATEAGLEVVDSGPAYEWGRPPAESDWIAWYALRINPPIAPSP